MNKQTKIIATAGPGCSNKETIFNLIKSGVNIFRLNFSHGDIQSHRNVKQMIEMVSNESGLSVKILQDLAGPKIRTGNFIDDKIKLEIGDRFALTIDELLGDKNRVSFNFPSLLSQVSSGDILRLDDGKVSLQVANTTEQLINTVVTEGGVIASRRGVNVPGVELDIDIFTDEDQYNVAAFSEDEFNYVSLSFVQSAADIINLKKFLTEHKLNSQVIAKIETTAAVKNFDEILDVSDAIMIARGDLAIETPLENVPLIQKEIIQKCRASGKMVIVATQMLESMIDNTIPTRAEVSDVANAVLDGADAVMLSGETAIGNHPVKTVKVMSKIINATENSNLYNFQTNE